MIRTEFPQGSAAWFEARLGLPTASQFDRILTPKALKPASGAVTYRHELLAEWLTGESQDQGTYDFSDRGQQMESEARRWYEMRQDVDIEQVGFLLRDDKRAGGSPDGLIGTDGGLELKCPSASTHVGYLLGNVADEYRGQVQGNLWITEREWWDVLSYHPTMPKALVRVYRDEVWLKAFVPAFEDFCARFAEEKQALRDLGHTPLLRAA